MDRRREQRLVMLGFFMLYMFFLVVAVSLYTSLYTVTGLFIGGESPGPSEQAGESVESVPVQTAWMEDLPLCCTCVASGDEESCVDGEEGWDCSCPNAPDTVGGP